MENPTRYAESADGTSVAYQVHGEGPIDLVFVPGFVSHAELVWEEPAIARFLRRLASFSRLIFFDKRGQGLSDRLGRPPTLEESMDDLRAAMDAAGSERAAVFGVSEGGPMSMLFAATYPDRVSSLILYGTFARMTKAPDFPEGVRPERLDAWAEMVREEWGGAVGVDLWAPTEAGNPEFERWWARLLRQGTSPRGAIELMNLYKEIDIRGALPAIDVPTLVLHHRDDRLVPVRQARYLERRIASARYVEASTATTTCRWSGTLTRCSTRSRSFWSAAAAPARPNGRWRRCSSPTSLARPRPPPGLATAAGATCSSATTQPCAVQLAVHRGHEVKTMGDGFLATFDGPARAIRCAVAIRDELRQTGIDVRAGIHTGEVDLIGTDVGGMAVNIGARVGALGGAGEVLVSSTVRELVVGSGIDFDDRGAHELKGAPGEWRLFAVNG